MEATKVTCATCGFLSTCDNNLQSIEVVHAMRTTGHIPPNITGSAGNRLICSMGKRAFGPVINNPIDGEAKRLLEEEHICLAYMPYKIGFSPKEHMAISFIEQIRKESEERLEKDRVWRDKKDNEEKEFQEKMLTRTERFQKDLQAELHAHTQNSEWNRAYLGLIGGLVGAVIGAAGTLLGAWISNPATK